MSGGIWKSTNGGTTWAPVNDFMPNVAISSIVRDPSDPQRMYAGTGLARAQQRMSDSGLEHQQATKHTTGSKKKSAEKSAGKGAGKG